MDFCHMGQHFVAMSKRDSEGYHRVNVRLEPADVVILESIRKHTGIKSDADLVRAALRAMQREIARSSAVPAEVNGAQQAGG